MNLGMLSISRIRPGQNSIISNIRHTVTVGSHQNMPLQDKNTFWEGAFPLRCRFSRPLSHCTRFRRLSKVEIVLLVESWRELKRVETKRGEVTRRGGHLCRVADNTVWSHWQVASRSSEVNFTKNYTLLFCHANLPLTRLQRCSSPTATDWHEDVLTNWNWPSKVIQGHADSVSRFKII